jgi:glycosyltransferase involved in cell wall biosynthesis
MISVLLSVYINDDIEIFKDAYFSIYHYQIFKPSEIVIVFDGPVASEIEQFIESEISNGIPINLVKSNFNIGLGAALNLGLSYATNDLIARMDSDDISVPNRFKIQHDFMLSNPNVDIVGGYIHEFDQDNIFLNYRKVPLEHSKIVSTLNYKNSMNHVTVMFRKSKIMEVGGYETRFLSFEDYATWLRARKSLTFQNISIVFVNVRINSKFLNRRSGFNYLLREINFYKSYFREGKINYYWYLFNITSRFFLRLAPKLILKYFYIMTRVKNV